MSRTGPIARIDAPAFLQSLSTTSHGPPFASPLTESLVIWLRNAGMHPAISLEDYHHAYRCPDFSEVTAWYLPDIPSRATLNDRWKSLSEGGVLAGEIREHRDLLKTWAASTGTKLHYAPPDCFWIQKPGSLLPAFRMWNQQIHIKVTSGHAFNPSICPHPTNPARRLFAYRTTKGLWHEGRIWIGEVDADDLQFVEGPHCLDLAKKAAGCEDPRIYILQGAVWLSYAISNWPASPARATQHLVPLEKSPDGRWLPAERPVDFPSPLQCKREKNWIFFSPREEELLILYSSEPEWRIHRLFTDSPMEYIPYVIAPGIQWPFGEIRGGTPLIPGPRGTSWTFFHSSLEHLPSEAPARISSYHGVLPSEDCQALLPSQDVWDTIPRHVRYFCGLLEIDGHTLLPTRISKQPLLYQTGHEKGRGHGGSHVIWPAGAIRDGDEVTVSYGLNDRSCHCARFSATLLEELLEPISNVSGVPSKSPDYNSAPATASSEASSATISADSESSGTRSTVKPFPRS